ncbi:MAG: S9 family peptidase [Marinilabiliales bacterium]
MIMKKSFLITVIISLFFNSLFAQEKKDIELTDIWSVYTFYPKTVDGIKSTQDGEHFTKINYGQSIEKFAFKNNKSVGVVFNLKDIPEEERPTKIVDYDFNNDETKILFYTDVEHIYRHSFVANYYVWDISNKKLINLCVDEKISLASFSPDGKKVAYVRDNNLYYYDLISNEEVQITKDGKINEIINGAPDWVYEEEFSFNKAYEWSPDSKYIAFIRFDESRVKEYNMTIYGELYPSWYKYKYPKAGEDNSFVSVHFYNINDKKTIKADLGEDYEYIPRIKWTNVSDILSVQLLNRLQNDFRILKVNAVDGKSELLYHETNPCYIEITDNLTFLKDGKHFIITSEKNGCNHLYLYDMDGNEIRQITSGEWEVTKFLGLNETEDVLFYISTEISPTMRTLYSINIDGKNKKLLSQDHGVCDIEFSNNNKYFVNFYSDANTPPQVSVHSSDGKLKYVLEDNKALKEKMNGYKFNKKEFFTFKTSEGIELYGWMIKPFDFDPSKKYPVFMTVYGGPGNQTVMDQWEYTSLWHQHLANLGYIVVSVDNRGTDGRGADFRRATYGQMGKLETIDQIEAAKYLGSLDFVDASRIGIQGWSYGGYMATLCMTKGNEYFKAGIAVAPVTNWRYYDSIYTERYMGLPQDNPDGYDENSPINFVRKLKGPYFLIHGTADDNVHFQNTVELVNELIQSDKDFKLMIYPNSNHGIYTGSNTRYHLFSLMTDFIKENL